VGKWYYKRLMTRGYLQWLRAGGGTGQNGT
jgi:hypothetical protein